MERSVNCCVHEISPKGGIFLPRSLVLYLPRQLGFVFLPLSLLFSKVFPCFSHAVCSTSLGILMLYRQPPTPPSSVHSCLSYHHKLPSDLLLPIVPTSLSTFASVGHIIPSRRHGIMNNCTVSQQTQCELLLSHVRDDCRHQRCRRLPGCLFCDAVPASIECSVGCGERRYTWALCCLLFPREDAALPDVGCSVPLLLACPP